MASANTVNEGQYPSGKLSSWAMVAGSPEKTPVILLHGAGPGANAAANWRGIMPELADHFYAVAPDLIGFGKSQYPDPYPTHIMTWMGLRVEQVLGLMDGLGIKKAHIVGNSMGGALTLQLLTEAPERFDKVVLMGSIGAPAPRTPELVRLLSFYADPRLPRFQEIARSFVSDPDTFPNIDEIARTRFEIAIRPEVRRIQEIMFQSMREGIETLVMPPSVLGRLPHQVLIFHGRQDRVVPLDTSLYLLKHLKHAELVVLDRCGHWTQIERWDMMGPMLKRHFGVAA
jgi:2-hydroxymuconate-semialdehyde hydrolase